MLPTFPSLFSRDAGPTTAEKNLKAYQQSKYVEELWLLLTAVIGLLAIINWSLQLLHYLRKPKRNFNDDITSVEKRSPEALDPGRTGRISIRKVPHAVVTMFRVIAFRTTIPIGPSSVMSVTELTFIVGYIVAILIWLWIDTMDMDTFYFEDRAAHLASCQLPLIVALAGKNNVISWLTGVGHEKLNVLHRAAARTCLLLLWIHALIRGTSGLPAKFDLSNGWMRWGVTGLTAFSLATILSIRPIRQKAFEFFLVTHIILIGIFLVGGYLHARDPGFGSYIWPALVVWGFDRSLRLIRILWNNTVWSDKRKDYGSATVELLTRDTVRLTLRRKMHWQAGQHAYIILPSVSNLPTEAHPFTIANVPHGLDGTEGPEEKEVTFIIRGRSGFTRKLREHASRKGAPGSVPAFIDGPYGCPPNLKTFSTCILIAGGSGVSYCLPLLMDLVHHARKGTSLCRRAIFVWVIREPEHLGWIAKALTGAIVNSPSSLSIEPRIYITSQKAQLPDITTLEYDTAEPSSPSSSSVEEKKVDPIPFAAFKTKRGRPNVHRIIQDAVAISPGPVSVDVAGPSPLASSVRTALASEITSTSAVLKGRAPVTLHVETFGMVKG